MSQTDSDILADVHDHTHAQTPLMAHANSLVAARNGLLREFKSLMLTESNTWRFRRTKGMIRKTVTVTLIADSMQNSLENVHVRYDHSYNAGLKRVAINPHLNPRATVPQQPSLC